MQFVDWVTPQQIADLADVSVGTVRYHIRHGLLLAVKRGRDWYVRSDEAKRWLDEYVSYKTRRPSK